MVLLTDPTAIHISSFHDITGEKEEGGSLVRLVGRETEEAREISVYNQFCQEFFFIRFLGSFKQNDRIVLRTEDYV